jgi:DNA-binding GntR family transcriptional regulator
MLSKQDVIEMSDVRTVLEGAAARTLAPKITAQEVAELRTLAVTVDHSRQHATARADWDRAEEAFHRRFLEMAGNSQIFEILERQGLMERLLTALPREHWRHEVDVGIATHQDLVDILATHDPQRSEQAFREHAEFRKRWMLAAYAHTDSG